MNDDITVDPRVCNGKPVTVILDQLAETGSVQEVMKRYPELSPEQVRAALKYSRSAGNRNQN